MALMESHYRLYRRKTSWHRHSAPVVWAKNPRSSLLLLSPRTTGALRAVYPERTKQDSSLRSAKTANELRMTTFQGFAATATAGISSALLCTNVTDGDSGG